MKKLRESTKISKFSGNWNFSIFENLEIQKIQKIIENQKN